LAVPAAPASEPLTARDLLGVSVPSSPVVSADGRTVAFVVTEPDFERGRNNSDVYMTTIGAAPDAARRLTRTPDANETRPRFSPDGRRLAFLSDRRAACDEATGDEEPKAQVWLMPLDGGEPEAITSAQGGVIAFEWTPDGASICYVATEVPSDVVQDLERQRAAARADRTVVDAERFRGEFWLIDLVTRKPRRVSAGDYGVADMRVSPDGGHVVYEANGTGRVDDELLYNLWMLDLATGETRRLTTRGGATHRARWSPDGKQISFVAYVDSTVEFGRVDAFVVPAAGGEPRNVSSRSDRSVEDLAWTGDGMLLAVLGEGTTSVLCRLGDAPQDTPQRLTDPRQVVREVTPAGRNAVVVAESATEAPDLWLLGGGAPIRMTDLNPALRARQLAEQQVVRWKAADGREIEGVLVLPAGSRPVPLVVAIHGGPYGRSLNALASDYYLPQLWAANGYAVLMPNYRGSDGYGEAFARANQGDIGGGDAQDILAGVDYLVKAGVADPARLGVMGVSYGGYLTNWLISQTDRFRGAISEAGIFNLITDFSNAEIPSWERQYLNGYYWERDNLRQYVDRSPFRYADRIKTPVLIMHGTEDNTTFISNSKEMYQALRARGQKVEFVQYPREAHMFDEPNHRLDQVRRWLAWFDEHVKGARGTAQAGDYVVAGNWEYTLSTVDGSPSYVGREPRGRFLEIVLLLRARAGAQVETLTLDRLSLDLPEGRSLHPLGFVSATHGARVLVAGSVELRPSSNDPKSIVPVVVAFDVPPEIQTAQVRVGSYAPIRFHLPED
jgi:dipeptidyl aminopeptidase/acylaminoacyl peptidase